MILDNSNAQFIHGKAYKAASLHFKVEVDNKNVLYTYIRKAACSAFKNFFTSMSAASELRTRYPSQVAFLAEQHRVLDEQQICDIDHSIVVIRDPIKRAVSCFVNKFIQRKGNADIFRNYQDLTGLNPYTTTFEQFCKKYLVLDEGTLDPHCQSYCFHLLPIRYTDAIRIEELSGGISAIFGKSIAKDYFEKKQNASGMTTTYSDDVSRMNANLLNEIANSSGTVPSTHSLATPELCEILHGIYFDDYEMIRSLKS